MQHGNSLGGERAKLPQGSAGAAFSYETWPDFYDKMRLGIIEAQCALQSGRAGRASELMDEIMRDAADCNNCLGLHPGRSNP